jgi:hypothetical protein
MHIRVRKALGCMALLAYLAIYAGLAAMFGGWLLMHAPQWLLAPYYLVAGLAWVAPLKPLFRWMNGA